MYLFLGQSVQFQALLQNFPALTGPFEKWLTPPHYLTISWRPPALLYWTRLQVWTMDPGQVPQAKSSQTPGWARDSMRSSVSPWISPSLATSKGGHGRNLSHGLAVCGHMDPVPSQMRQHVCWLTCTWGFLAGHLERASFASSGFIYLKRSLKSHFRFLQRIWTRCGMWFIFGHIAADSDVVTCWNFGSAIRIQTDANFYWVTV